MSLGVFTKHLEDVGLKEEADILNSLINQKSKTALAENRIKRANSVDGLEWEIAVVNNPDRRLTSRDVCNYYTEIKDKLLKGLAGRKLLSVQKDKTSFVDLLGNLNEQRQLLDQLAYDKMLGLRSLIGPESKNVCVELAPGKDFEFGNVKKVVPNIVELIRSVPGVKKKVPVYFSGDNGFYVSGGLKEEQKVDFLAQLLSERLNDYVQDKSNVVVGTPDDGQLGLDISNFKNTGSFPVPYSLNPTTGLVIVPVENIDLFRKEYADVRRVLGHKPRGIVSSLLKAVEGIEVKAFRRLSSKHIRQLAAKGDFDPRRYARDLQKGFEEQGREIIDEAKQVKDRASWSRFKSKYSESDVMRAYAMQAAIATLSKVFKSVDPETRLDVFNKVLYDPERKCGITKAIISYDPSKEGAKALNGYINDHINNGILNAIKEATPDVPEEHLSERMDEGDETAATKEHALHEIGDFDITVRDLKRTIRKIREIISTQWKDDPVYGEPEQAVDLFNYFISGIVTNPSVSEVFVDEPYLTRDQIIEKRGIQLPNVVCLDCGNKLEFEHNWQNQIRKYLEEGCPVQNAKEHQAEWTDGLYDREKAASDPEYRYRIGFERAPGSGSNSGRSLLVAGLRGLSKFAQEEEDIFFTPEVGAEALEEHEEIVDVSRQRKDYVDALPSSSYEFRRIKGLNFDVQNPENNPDVIDSVQDFNNILDHFSNKLATSLTTAPYYEQFKELVTELSNLVEERQYKIR